MADRVYWFTNTIPALTPLATPFVANMKFNSADVEKIIIVVPPGPGGSVGFQILSGGGQFVPQTPGQFIVAEDHVFEIPQNKAPNNGDWEFNGYNTDYVTHTIQVGFYVNDFTSLTIPTSQLIGL
jgi:hypothetical protein